jgi:hypothetical protein
VCALYLRKGDAYAGVMLGSYLRIHCMELARALAHRDWFMARQRWLALRGWVQGFGYGLWVR